MVKLPLGKRVFLEEQPRPPKNTKRIGRGRGYGFIFCRRVWQNSQATSDYLFMKRYLLPTISLILLLFCPIQAQETLSPVPPASVSSTPERFNTTAETNYLTTLALRG